MTLVMFGIKNCDTVRKARAWLAAAGIGCDFHDLRAQGIDAATVSAWVAARGWETVLNRAGTTFRSLPESDKSGIDADRAVALMVAQPAMIKRPVLVGAGILIIGFKPALYAAALGQPFQKAEQ